MVRTGETISLKTRQGWSLGLWRWLHLHLYRAPGRLQESGKEELQGTSRYSQGPGLTWCWVKFPHTHRQLETFKELQNIYNDTYTATCGTVLPWPSQLPSETSASLAAKKCRYQSLPVLKFTIFMKLECLCLESSFPKKCRESGVETPFSKSYH